MTGPVSTPSLSPPQLVTFRVTQPVPMDKIFCFVYKPGQARNPYSTDQGCPRKKFQLKVPEGDYVFQILGFSQTECVAGRYGSAMSLLNIIKKKGGTKQVNLIVENLETRR